VAFQICQTPFKPIDVLPKPLTLSWRNPQIPKRTHTDDTSAAINANSTIIPQPGGPRPTNRYLAAHRKGGPDPVIDRTPG
jgi:hypothetical protein